LCFSVFVQPKESTINEVITMTIGRFENVTKVYEVGKVQVHALRGVSMEIEQGEFLSIAGPSGSGKTTMLNLIGCLDKPTTGAVFIGDKEVSELSANQSADIRKQNIGFVFQTFNLVPVLSAYENVEFPLILSSISAQERRDAVEAILEEVGLAEMKDRRPNELSGGQQQRVAIARALVKQPKLVLADEPTANLDSETGEGILQLMQRMNEAHQATFVFSTHDKMVMDYAKRLVRLHDGLIVSDERRG